MGVALLRVTRLTRPFRLGTVFHSRHYCSGSRSTEVVKASGDNSVDENSTTPDPPSEEAQNATTEQSSKQNEEKPEMVDMWNKNAIAGPEWNGPRGYEPTRYGDWSSKGRATDF